MPEYLAARELFSEVDETRLNAEAIAALEKIKKERIDPRLTAAQKARETGRTTEEKEDEYRFSFGDHERASRVIESAKHFLRLREKDGCQKEALEALREMESKLKETHRSVFDDPARKLRDLLNFTDKTLDLQRKILAEIGTKPLEILQSSHGNGWKDPQVYLLGRFEDEGDQKTADAYIAFMAEGIFEEFNGKKPQEIRKATLSEDKHNRIMGTLRPLITRLSKGETLSPAMEEVLAKKLLPIAEASDSFIEGDSHDTYNRSSRFVTEEWLDHELNFNHGDPNIAKVVKQRLEEIKQRITTKASS